jgi:hypothetical protein
MMAEKWIVVEPGGPAGPFYSVVTNCGGVVAMQIPEQNTAERIARVPELEQRIRDQDALIAPGSDEIWKAVEHLYEVANTPAKDVGSDMSILYAAMQALLDAWDKMLG